MTTTPESCYHRHDNRLLATLLRIMQVNPIIEDHESKKKLASTITMRKMWLEFTRQNPNFRTHQLNLRNKGPVIRCSTFRNIFYCDLRESLSL